MNWTALVVVTGLSTLFMIIQYVANQRQYDFNLDSPIVPRPANHPPSAGSAVDDLTDRHRGIGFSFDARSDDDCSSYLLSKPRPQAAAEAAVTPSDLRNHDNGGPCAEQRNAGTDCTGRGQPTTTTQPTATNYHGAGYCNSEPSIGCGGGIRQGAQRGSSSSPCRSFEGSASSNSFEYRETQSPVTDELNQSGIKRGCSADAIEIITSPCDQDSLFKPEVTACEDNDVGEQRGSQCRSRQRLFEQQGLALSRSLDYIIRFLNVLLVLLLIIEWVIGVQRDDDEDDDDGIFGGARSSRNPCSSWRNFFSLMGFDSPDCEPAWAGCQKR